MGDGIIITSIGKKKVSLESIRPVPSASISYYIEDTRAITNDSTTFDH